jgi:hypothetical protein
VRRLLADLQSRISFQFNRVCLFWFNVCKDHIHSTGFV